MLLPIKRIEISLAWIAVLINTPAASRTNTFIVRLFYFARTGSSSFSNLWKKYRRFFRNLENQTVLVSFVDTYRYGVY
jgi:hypothetical protein